MPCGIPLSAARPLQTMVKETFPCGHFVSNVWITVERKGEFCSGLSSSGKECMFCGYCIIDTPALRGGQICD